MHGGLIGNDRVTDLCRVLIGTHREKIEMQYINDGPSFHEIFDAAKYATKAGWDTPLKFNIEGHLITFTWVNGLTWMGERSIYLVFTVKYQGVEYRVEYDTKMRSGEITPTKLGDPDILTLHEQHKRGVVGRIRGTTL